MHAWLWCRSLLLLKLGVSGNFPAMCVWCAWGLDLTDKYKFWVHEKVMRERERKRERDNLLYYTSKQSGPSWWWDDLHTQDNKFLRFSTLIFSFFSFFHFFHLSYWSIYFYSCNYGQIYNYYLHLLYNYKNKLSFSRVIQWINGFDTTQEHQLCIAASNLSADWVSAAWFSGQMGLTKSKWSLVQIPKELIQILYYWKPRKAVVWRCVWSPRYPCMFTGK
jgi:hypothetical protein